MGSSKKRERSKERKKKKHTKEHSDDEHHSSKRKDKERLELNVVTTRMYGCCNTIIYMLKNHLSTWW